MKEVLEGSKGGTFDHSTFDILAQRSSTFGETYCRPSPARAPASGSTTLPELDEQLEF